MRQHSGEAWKGTSWYYVVRKCTARGESRNIRCGVLREGVTESKKNTDTGMIDRHIHDSGAAGVAGMSGHGMAGTKTSQGGQGERGRQCKSRATRAFD